MPDDAPVFLLMNSTPPAAIDNLVRIDSSIATSKSTSAKIAW
jgi:hypothetical protein